MLINDSLMMSLNFLRFEKKKVAYSKGTGTVTGPNEVKVTGLDGTTSTLRAKNIVIATGSEVAPLGGITVGVFLLRLSSFCLL